YCLYYEASTNMIELLTDSLAVSVAGGGMMRSRKQRLAYLPYKDIVRVVENGDTIQINMSYVMLIRKGSLFNKQIATDTFLLRPADKDSFMTALRGKELGVVEN
ncbi:MAG: hypothetical protein FWE20_12750, partial [Defluviitaleaceae bacterium]|nr:hypothetical protein [Defluviitaleaceae bacterium]